MKVSLSIVTLLVAPLFALSETNLDDQKVTSDEMVDTKNSVYHELAPNMWASELAYAFASILEQEVAGKLNSTKPELVQELLKPVKSGIFPMPYSDLYEFVEQNQAAMGEGDKDMAERVLQADLSDSYKERIWLEAFDFAHGAKESDFFVVRDDSQKRIYLSFRGSVVGNRDWPRNFQATMTKMQMPKKLRELMEDKTGKDNEFVLVHQGFYDYLFDNKERTSRKHKYDKAIKALERVYNQYPDYELVVTGHSLGAALAALMAFKLAGSGKDWIPTPVTCISFSSPFTGGSQFRDAFKILETENLVRYLRVTNQEDTVPAIPPVSLFGLPLLESTLRFGMPYKHVGVHLNLYKDKLQFSYPTSDNRISRALENNILGKSWWHFWSHWEEGIFPIGVISYFHSVFTIQERVNMHKDLLEQTYLEDLYKQYLNNSTSTNDEL